MKALKPPKQKHWLAFFRFFNRNDYYI